MGNDQNSSYLSLPENLPIPKDDGAANHLVGMKMPQVNLFATNGELMDLAKLSGLLVLFCYPMTGVPGIPLPPGWDDIPGARGCTPQACSYRDSYPELRKLVTKVFGISTQSSSYQKELHDRLELPYEILSDDKFELQTSLNLPTFEVEGKRLLKRLTLVVRDGLIDMVHYPVFPSNKDVDWVLEKLSK
ncbi:MAG: peroxiredoxin [Actinomycetales bacterium]